MQNGLFCIGVPQISPRLWTTAQGEARPRGSGEPAQMVGTTALLCLAVLLPGPRAPLWRAVPVRTRRSVVVGTADSALAAAKPPPLPTREEIEQMDTLVELHARLALHGADFPGRRKAPLRNRLLELSRSEPGAGVEVKCGREVDQGGTSVV